MSKKIYFSFLLIVIGILLYTPSWAQYKFIKEISARADSIPHFDWLEGVATDSKGNIYAAEFIRGSVVIVDSTGKLLNELQTGQLTQPYDIAVDDSSYIYVAAMGSGIVKMNITGEILLNINLVNAYGVGVDHLGNIYASGDGYYVRKYNKEGVLIKLIGGLGTTNGLFTAPPRCFTIDDKDNVYVTAGNMIHKFNTSGTFVKRFGGTGSLDGQFSMAEGITFDKNNGNIIVCDFSLNRIQIFDSTGIFIRKFGNTGLINGTFYNPRNVAMDRYNNIIVVDRKDDQVGILGIQKFDYLGEFIKRFGITGNEDSILYQPIDIKIDSESNIYVLDFGKACVLKYDSTWKFLMKIGYRNDTGIDSSFSFTNEIRLDKNNYLYVWDYYGSNIQRIQRFKPNGTFDSSWIKTGLDTIFRVSSLVAYDANGNKFVSNSVQIDKYNSSNVLKSSIGKSGYTDGNFYSAYGICIDKRQKLYVSDQYNNRIQIFEPVPRIKVRNIDSTIFNNNYVYNFGSCQPGTTLSKQFIIENVGNKDLIISAVDIVSPNPAFIIDNTNTSYTISKDDSTKILLKFSPINTGNQTDSIKIASNDYLATSFSYSLKGTTKAVLNVKVDNLQYNYGGPLTVEKTTTDPKIIVTVENLGFENLIIDSVICFTGCDYYSVDKTNFNFNISAFNNSTFTIVYSPLASTGNIAQIIIYSKNEQHPVFLISPLGMNLTGIEDKTLISDNINLFPNPATQNVSVNSIFNIEQIRVVDVIGNEVMDVSTTGNTQIDVSTLPKGLYNFVITTDKGVGSKKVSVQ